MTTPRSYKKILAFDSWTEGSRHLLRLIDAFAEENMRIKLVHLGSWGNEPSRPKQEKFGDMEVSDISSYHNGSFEAVLDAEKPDAVIMLSTATFAHRAFLRYCHQRSIPTLHLYHGLMSVQVTDDHVGSVKVNKVAHIKYVSARIVKLVSKTFPCYVTALLKTGGKVNDWVRFIYDAGKLALGLPIWQPNVAFDAKTTKCAVFNEADRQHANRVYRLNMDDIVAVGNPDLIFFGLTDEMLNSYQLNERDKSNEIIYVDTGLIMQGLIFKDLEDFVRHLSMTAEILRRQGYRMALKPHPAHDLKKLERYLHDVDIEIVKNEDFIIRLLSSQGCIAEPSSATLVPALLGVPLLLAKYGKLDEVRFGELLTSYPGGEVLSDIESVGELLKAWPSKTRYEVLENWGRRNSGPLPAKDMPRRVSKLVKTMVKSQNADVS
jgi:hypothetical protein